MGPDLECIRVAAIWQLSREWEMGQGMATITRLGGPYDYITMGDGWWRWMGPDTDDDLDSPCVGEDFPDEGWKLHIGGKPENAQAIYNAVAPRLFELPMAHKVRPDTEPLTRLTGEAAGKWLVAYPRHLMHAFAAVSLIDREIRLLYSGQGRGDLAMPVGNDIPVGDTIVYSRYGGFRWDCVRGENGGLVADSREGFKPGWISNPWGEFSGIAGRITSGAPTLLPAGLAHPFPTYNPDEKREAERRFS